MPMVSSAADPLLLSGFEKPLHAEWKNKTQPESVPFTAETDAEKVKQGESSGKWQNLGRNKWLVLQNCPTDWSDYEGLSFWLYSENANGQKINLTVGSPSKKTEDGEGNSYFHHQVEVDWTGWKHILVPFTDFVSNRSPKGWSEVTGLQLSSAGWKATPLPDSVLYLDQLELVRR